MATAKRIAKRAKEFLGLRWQNLDERTGDGGVASGSLLRHGRAWVRPWGWERIGFRIEWSLWSGLNLVDFSLNPDEGEISGCVAINPVFVSWAVSDIWKHLQRLGLDGPWDEPGGFKGYKKDLKLSYGEGSFHWTVWYDDDHWSSEMPRWRMGYFDILRSIFGDTVHTEETVKGPVEVEFPMPERTYKGTVELRRETWKRPRLPWESVRIVRAHIETGDDPIPHPGKGENSWDCGEDATYSLTTKAGSVAEAIGKMVGCVMRSRERYGGLDWRPERIAD